MNGAGSSRRGIQLAVPAAISKRLKCDGCGRIASIGQFPLNSETCLRCKPMGKTFRRGGL